MNNIKLILGFILSLFNFIRVISHNFVSNNSNNTNEISLFSGIPPGSEDLCPELQIAKYCEGKPDYVCASYYLVQNNQTILQIAIKECINILRSTLVSGAGGTLVEPYWRCGFNDLYTPALRLITSNWTQTQNQTQILDPNGPLLFAGPIHIGTNRESYIEGVIKGLSSNARVLFFRLRDEMRMDLFSCYLEGMERDRDSGSETTFNVSIGLIFGAVFLGLFAKILYDRYQLNRRQVDEDEQADINAKDPFAYGRKMEKKRLERVYSILEKEVVGSDNRSDPDVLKTIISYDDVLNIFPFEDHSVFDPLIDVDTPNVEFEIEDEKENRLQKKDKKRL